MSLAQKLLITWAMRSSTRSVAADPWAPDIDNGWRDLVISSAPPPPPREAFDTGPKNRALPSDLNTWQEHGAPRHRAAEVAPVEEPHFTADDRRLWRVAGALMALAVLVLGVLGWLTFGGSLPVAQDAPAAAADAPAAPEPHASAVAPAHERAAAAHTALAAATLKSPPPVGPRALKRTRHTRHHKRVATR